MLSFLTDALAVSRITRLITEDKITEPLRDSIEGRFSGSRLAYLVTCPLCVSVWAGAAVVISSRSKRLSQPHAALVRMLALSEATIALRKITDG